jgi:hypothetical protein
MPVHVVRKRRLRFDLSTRQRLWASHRRHAQVALGLAVAAVVLMSLALVSSNGVLVVAAVLVMLGVLTIVFPLADASTPRPAWVLMEVVKWDKTRRELWHFVHDSNDVPDSYVRSAATGLGAALGAPRVSVARTDFDEEVDSPEDAYRSGCGYTIAFRTAGEPSLRAVGDVDGVWIRFDPGPPQRVQVLVSPGLHAQAFEAAIS